MFGLVGFGPRRPISLGLQGFDQFAELHGAVLDLQRNFGAWIAKHVDRAVFRHQLVEIAQQPVADGLAHDVAPRGRNIGCALAQAGMGPLGQSRQIFAGHLHGARHVDFDLHDRIPSLRSAPVDWKTTLRIAGSQAFGPRSTGPSWLVARQYVLHIGSRSLTIATILATFPTLPIRAWLPYLPGATRTPLNATSSQSPVSSKDPKPIWPQAKVLSLAVMIGRSKSSRNTSIEPLSTRRTMRACRQRSSQSVPGVVFVEILVRGAPLTMKI